MDRSPPAIDAHRTGLLRWIEEFAQQGIFTTDTDLVIRTWNRWLEAATGYTAAELVGRPLAEALPDMVTRGFEPYYRAALEGEVSVLAHALHRQVIAPRERPDRDVRQSGRIVPLISDGTIVGTITVIDDVSERVASERELRAQIEASEQARRLAEEAVRVKDEFLTTLSHEIRTPLNAVLGWTRILMTRSAEPETLQRALEIIDRNAESQARLIEDMLDTARIMSGKLRLEPRLVDLGRVALAAVDVVAPTAAAKGVQLRTEIGEGPVTMKGDPDRLQQVVWNLLSNAIKFTEAGGRVTVAVASAPPGVLTLTVTDTGEGIPETFLPQLFERFRQADPSAGRRHGGLGIGLSLVRQLVELHGGRITARSTVGEGATFIATFPAWVETVAPVVQAPDTPSLERVRVLVVGDEEDSRELLAVALRQSGAEVTAVAEAREAVALLERAEARARPQAIVADVGGGAALSLVRDLRASLPAAAAIPAVAVISTDHVFTRERVQDAGFQIVVAKPISPSVLAAAVRDATDPGR